MKEKKHLSRRDFLRLSGLAAVGTVVASCVPAPSAAPVAATTAPGAAATTAPAAAEPVTLTFTFWGSPNEQSAMEATEAKFTAEVPSIKINSQHYPNDAYVEKVTTLISGGTPPDVAYLFESFCEQVAVQGQLLDCGPVFKADPVMSKYMNSLNPYYGGILCGTGIANEFQVVFYDKRPFRKEGIEMPPSDPAKAWTMEKYIETAKLLTKDSSGRNATDANFDKDNINTYGMTLNWSSTGLVQMGISNGGTYTSPDGMKLTMDTPEMTQVGQDWQDMIWKAHVSPSPAILSSNNMTTAKLMDTGKVVMDYNGHWNFLEYPGTSVELGVACLPYYKNLVSYLECSPISVFKATKYINQSFEWYKFMHDPAKCDLFKEGLWAPVTSDYYEKPELTDAWLKGKPGVYPDEAKQVFVDFVYKYSLGKKCWMYNVKNNTKIDGELMGPAYSSIAANEKTAEQAYKDAVASSASYMQGMWPDINA